MLSNCRVHGLKKVITRHCNFAIIALPILSAAMPAHSQSSSTTGGPEEIYIARPLRLTRFKPTDYCKTYGAEFEYTAKDTYDFLSVAVRDTDGRITNTHVSKIGDLRACNARTATLGTGRFFAEGQLGGIPFKGAGECVMMKSIAPTEGIVPFRCYLELTDLPAAYVGGHLTTNTTNSKILTGEVTDPPGFTMPSIATVRLWKK